MRCVDNDYDVTLNLLLNGNAFMFDNLDKLDTNALYLPGHLEMSHHLNKCSMHKATGDKEVLMHFSLLLLPSNIFTIKNLAYLYELHGLVGAAKDLHVKVPYVHRKPLCKQRTYAAAIRRVLRHGHGATMGLYGPSGALGRGTMPADAPAHPETSASHLTSRQTHRCSCHVSRQALPGNSRIAEEFSVFRCKAHICYCLLCCCKEDLPLLAAGVSPGVVMQLYALCVWHLYGPSFLRPDEIIPPPAPSALLTTSGAGESTIRLGVISEHHSNSSPGLCLEVDPAHSPPLTPSFPLVQNDTI